ncbi:MAG: AraC family transcriptional regulator [Clostridia bacterium]|nr:AraC family transcriptional regulator [Clostridia bacterium]
MEVNNRIYDRFEVPFFIERQRTTSNFNMPGNHYHNAYEIYYLLEGERLYFIKDKTYHVRKGDLVVIDAYELHKTIDAGVPAVDRILINFKRESLGFLLPHTQDADLLSCFHKKVNILKLDVDEQNFIQALLSKMLAENQLNSIESGLYTKLLLAELLIFLRRHMERNVEIQHEFLNPQHKKISEMVEYINLNYSNRLTLASLSEHFYLSSFHLSRIFKKLTGFSLIEYLNHVRTQQACKLLTGTRMSITDIAEKVGFESITHFGRTFKSIVGLTPLSYRKKYLQKD